jgi:uncharacterized protein (TIGR02453 family)
LTFYEGLEADNSRAYWQANKAVYDAGVRAPFLALSPLVEKEFGPLHVFRPNRDVRFSKDKSPYKTAAAAVTEGPGGSSYYVQISSEGLYVGCGYYMFGNDQLERWRDAVADTRRGNALRKVLEDLAKKYDVSSRDALKSAPRGYPRDHPNIDLLRRKGLHAGREFGAPRWLHTKAAADKIMETWRATKPMTQWLDKYVGPSPAPPE